MPKLIYLDQNKWIDIARAHYGRDDGKPFVPVLADLTKRVGQEEIIIPMSAIHYIETSRPEDKERRERLARFMVKLSKGYGILPFNSIRDIEVQQAIMRKLTIVPHRSIKEIVVGKRLAFALGADIAVESTDPKIVSELTSLIGEEETLIKLLVDAVDRSLAREFVEEDKSILAQLEESRRKQQEDLTKEMRLRLAIAEMASGSLNSIVVNHLMKIGVSVKSFADSMNNAEDWIAFFLDIPTMDIWINLNVLRDNDTSRPIHRNDTNDIAFLAVAVPYCDVVVTESYWAHQLKNNGFDKKYNCIILTSLLDLPDVLNQLGK